MSQVLKCLNVFFLLSCICLLLIFAFSEYFIHVIPVISACKGAPPQYIYRMQCHNLLHSPPKDLFNLVLPQKKETGYLTLVEMAR